MSTRQVGRNALRLKPPQQIHRLKRSKTYSGRRITDADYYGVHTANGFDMAAVYAVGAVETCHCGYPVVVELDVSGLTALPDIDAVMEAEDAVFDNKALREIALNADSIWDAIDEISESLSYAQLDVGVGSDWIDAVFEDFSFVNLAQAFVNVYKDEDLALRKFKQYGETGTVSDRVLADLTAQRRWLHNFELERVQRVYAFKPVYPKVLDVPYDDESDAKIAAIENAGYTVITLEDLGQNNLVKKLLLYENSDYADKSSGEYHGTSSQFLEAAFPALTLPAVAPFSVAEIE